MHTRVRHEASLSVRHVLEHPLVPLHVIFDDYELPNKPLVGKTPCIIWVVQHLGWGLTACLAQGSSLGPGSVLRHLGKADTGKEGRGKGRGWGGEGGPQQPGAPQWVYLKTKGG